MPLCLDVLANHGYVQVLNRVYVLTRFVVDSAKHENLFTLEGTRGVVVSASIQLWQVLPLVSVDIIHFAGGTGANATTRDCDEMITDSAS